MGVGGRWPCLSGAACHPDFLHMLPSWGLLLILEEGIPRFPSSCSRLLMCTIRFTFPPLTNERACLIGIAPPVEEEQYMNKEFQVGRNTTQQKCGAFGIRRSSSDPSAGGTLFPAVLGPGHLPPVTDMGVCLPAALRCFPGVKAHLTGTFPAFEVSQREVREHRYQRPEDLAKIRTSGPLRTLCLGTGRQARSLHLPGSPADCDSLST